MGLDHSSIKEIFPPWARQGGPLGQDTVRVGTFWGVSEDSNILISKSKCAPTDLFEKVFIFRDSHETQTNLLEKVLIFCDSHAKSGTHMYIKHTHWHYIKIMTIAIIDRQRGTRGSSPRKA